MLFKFTSSLYLNVTENNTQLQRCIILPKRKFDDLTYLTTLLRLSVMLRQWVEDKVWNTGGNEPAARETNYNATRQSGGSKEKFERW